MGHIACCLIADGVLVVESDWKVTGGLLWAMAQGASARLAARMCVGVVLSMVREISGVGGAVQVQRSPILASMPLVTVANRVPPNSSAKP
jgi:hypothetical protein